MGCNLETVVFDRTERVQELKLEIELAAELIQHWKDQNCAAENKKEYSWCQLKVCFKKIDDEQQEERRQKMESLLSAEKPWDSLDAKDFSKSLL